jgi:hypothetical protein
MIRKYKFCSEVFMAQYATVKDIMRELRRMTKGKGAQHRFAKKTGVNPGYLSIILRVKSRSRPKVRTINSKLLRYLGYEDKVYYKVIDTHASQ